MADQLEHLVRIADVARELGLSASRIRQLADSGVIPSSRTPGGHRLFDLAAVRAAVVRRSLVDNMLTAVATGKPAWQRKLTLLGLAEDTVWRRVVDDVGLDLASNAGRIMGYAFTEMLNNAIDHSDSETVTITWWTSPDQWSFEIKDNGRGAFEKLRLGLHLASEFEAVQELSKGKRTTNSRGTLERESSSPRKRWISSA